MSSSSKAPQRSLSRDTLILATRLLDPEIRAVGGRSALLMIWPELGRFSVFDDVRLSYQLAADTVGGLFLPAGEAWRAALAADPGLPLWTRRIPSGRTGHLRGRAGGV